MLLAFIHADPLEPLKSVRKTAPKRHAELFGLAIWKKKTSQKAMESPFNGKSTSQPPVALWDSKSFRMNFHKLGRRPLQEQAGSGMPLLNSKVGWCDNRFVERRLIPTRAVESCLLWNMSIEISWCFEDGVFCHSGSDDLQYGGRTLLLSRQLLSFERNLKFRIQLRGLDQQNKLRKGASGVTSS